RANKELAAYFRGQRTEREARNALKTIKAYVRYRERLDPAAVRPSPAARPPRTTPSRSPKKAATGAVIHRRRSPAEEPVPTAGNEIADAASPIPMGTRVTGD